MNKIFGYSFSIWIILLFGCNCLASEGEEKMLKIKMASLSFVPVKWDKKSNLEKIESMVREAAANQAKIVITPEGAVEGYLVNEVLHKKNEGQNLDQKFFDIAESRNGPSVTKISQLAEELQVDIILGILERADSTLYNSAIWINSIGNIVHVHRKTHMAQDYYKPDFYHPGDSIRAFDTDYGKFGMMICFERQIPEVARVLALDGARILFNPSYGSRGEWNDMILRARARDNNAPLIFTHPLQTLVINRKGEILLNNNDKEGISYFELAVEPQDSNKFRQRRPEVFKDITSTELNPYEKPKD